MLFVPGNDPRKLNKSLGCGADALILDLEDAVPDAEKARAREITAAFVRDHGDRTLFVRVNALESGLLWDDLAAVVQSRPYGIMLPKCAGVQDLAKVDAYLSALETRDRIEAGSVRVLPIVTETAAAVLNIGSYAQLAAPRLCGMLWGGEDLATDVGAAANRSEAGRYTPLFQMARSMTLLGAAATRVMAVDAVYTNFRDPVGLRAEAMQARRDGFSAKAAIHPDQVGPINEVFQPREEELAQARQVIAAFDAAPGTGSISIAGHMFDRPHYLAARRLLEGAPSPDHSRNVESA